MSQYNRPFPENYDFRDGKRTVLRLNATRVSQIRENNRTFYSTLREMSSEPPENNPNIQAAPNLTNQQQLNTSALKTPTADQTWTHNNLHPNDSRQNVASSRSPYRAPTCSNESCAERRASLRNEIAIFQKALADSISQNDKVSDQSQSDFS